MPIMEKLSRQAARSMMLAAQGLLTPLQEPASKQHVLDCIRRMGVLQIDTIHIVARSPYLVLFSRLGDYQPSWLDELEAEGALFEYWAHAACFIPVEDYPLFRRLMLSGSHPNYISPEWLAEQQATIEQVYQRIQNEGPLRSVDFKQTKRPGLWWNWKDEKRILEHLFNQGDLMIARREKFQRVYDLRQRVLPEWRDNQAPQMEEVQRALVKRSVFCVGLARPEWVADYYRLPKTGLATLLKTLVASGQLILTEVEGFNDPLYVHPDNVWLYEQALADSLKPTLTTLLSPFDPLVWDRARARQLFNFDYAIESYLPAVKRRYGYYCLPILQQGQLLGRLDAKAYRSDRIFEVRALYLEAGIELDESQVEDLANALQRCANWHNCPQVKITGSNPEPLSERLNQFF